MPPTESHSPADALIAACADALRRGDREACAELADRHPEHAAELSEFVENFDRLERNFSPLRRLADGTPSSEPDIATMGQVESAGPSSPAVGEVFGDYELQAEIARGAWGSCTGRGRPA